MKKILLFPLLYLFCCCSSNAQSLQLMKPDGTLLYSGDIVYMNGDTSYYTSLIEYLWCENTGSTSVDIKVKKIEISVISGSQNSFCWDVCYPPAVYESVGYITIPAGDTSKAFTGEYKPRGHLGYAYIRYCFFEATDTTDTLCIFAKFDCTLSGIKTATNDRMELTKAYPNPANNRFRIYYNIPAAEKDCRLIVSDVLGNKVYEKPLMDKAGAVEFQTDKLSNGIYFYSLISGKYSCSTRKLIVQH